MRAYPGVPRDATYPEVARRHIERQRPGRRLSLAAHDFYHPAVLQQQVTRAVSRDRPHVVVIDVGAFFLATGPGPIDLSRFPRGVRTAYDRVRHLRAASTRLLSAFPLGSALVRRIDTGARALADGTLRSVIRRYPRPGVPEYQRCLEDALRSVPPGGPTIVLQGPGGFNPDEASPAYAPDTVEIYDAVNAMTRRVATAFGLPMVDRMGIGGGTQRPLFLDGSSRHSKAGHRLMGQALAETLLASGVI